MVFRNGKYLNQKPVISAKACLIFSVFFLIEKEKTQTSMKTMRALIGSSVFNEKDVFVKACLEDKNESLERLLRSSRKWKSHAGMEKL